jgi:hypothetical protein
MNLLLGTLAMGRARANARMTETVLIETVVPGDPDPVTLDPTEVRTPTYSGPARVVYPPTVLVRDEVLASQLLAKQEVRVDLPAGTVVATDQQVTVTASAADVGMVGRVFRIKGAGTAGQTTALRVPVEELS